MPHNVRLIAPSASVGNVCSLQATCCTAAAQHELFARLSVELLSKSIFYHSTYRLQWAALSIAAPRRDATQPQSPPSHRQWQWNRIRNLAPNETTYMKWKQNQVGSSYIFIWLGYTYPRTGATAGILQIALGSDEYLEQTHKQHECAAAARGGECWAGGHAHQTITGRCAGGHCCLLLAVDESKTKTNDLGNELDRLWLNIALASWC